MLQYFVTLSLAVLVAAGDAKPTTGFALPYPFGVEKIIGGKPAAAKQFPYQVSLQWGRSSYKTRHFCGGFILSERWIMTAAHCPLALPGHGVFAIKAGKLKLYEYESHEQTRFVGRIFIHGDYHGGVGPNDIALLHLKTPLVFNEYVLPIELPDAAAEHHGNVVLSGWGSVTPKRGAAFPLDFDRRFQIPNNLQYVELPLIDYQSCRKAIDDNAENPDEIPLYPTNVCTGPLTGDHSPCVGDSGGPLVQRKSNGKLEVVGIVSWGFIPCDSVGVPSVYTKVSAHHKWILSTISSYNDNANTE